MSRVVTGRMPPGEIRFSARFLQAGRSHIQKTEPTLRITLEPRTYKFRPDQLILNLRLV